MYSPVTNAPARLFRSTISGFLSAFPISAPPALFVNDGRVPFSKLNPDPTDTIDFACLGDSGEVVCFVRVVADRREYRAGPIRPTMSLKRKAAYGDNRMLEVFVLDEGAHPDDVAAIIAAADFAPLDQPFPIPPVEGWEFGIRNGRRTSLKALKEVYLGDVPAAAEVPLFNESVIAATPFGKFVERYVTADPGKPIPTDVRDEKGKVPVIVLDIPSTMTDVIDVGINWSWRGKSGELIDGFGELVAFRHTRNHRSETLIPVDSVALDDDLKDRAVIARILRNAKGYNVSRLDALAYVGERVVNERDMHVFTHPEIGDHRLVLPLRHSVPTDQAQDIKNAFAEYLDVECSDTPDELSRPRPEDKLVIWELGTTLDPRALLVRRKKLSGETLGARFDKEDKARAKYEVAIDSLSASSTPDDIEAVLDLLIEANLELLALDKALGAIKKATGLSVGVLKKTCQAKKDVRDKAAMGKTVNDGQMIFPYNGDFNFMEGVRFTTKALKRINENAAFPVLCRMDHQMVEMNRDKSNNVTFRQLNYTSLWAWATEKVAFVRRTERGDGAREAVPDKITKFLFERATTWAPEAPQVCAAPVFLKDGQIISKPGYSYDPDKGINHYLILPNPEQFAVIECPTEEDVKEAVEWFDTEIFCDFHFNDAANADDKRKAGRANSFAMLVTRAMRPMIGGVTPLFFPIKAMSGEGASLLARTPSLIQRGKNPQIISYSGNDEELEKIIVSAIREGIEDLFLDDVTDLNSKPLHRYLTSDTVSGRLLGTSTYITRQNIFHWYGSGINPNVKEESARRIVPIVLNSDLPLEKMKDRKFRHPEVSGMTLEEFILSNRGTAVRHLITMIRHWIEKGQPFWTSKETLPSFEDWARKVGGVLEVCGIDGFLSHTPLNSRNTEDAANNQLARETIKKYGLNIDNGQTFDDLWAFHRDANSSITAGITDYDYHDKFLAKLSRIQDAPLRVWQDDTNFSDYALRRKYAKKESNYLYYFEEIKKGTIKPDDETAP